MSIPAPSTQSSDKSAQSIPAEVIRRHDIHQRTRYLAEMIEAMMAGKWEIFEKEKVSSGSQV
jgi:hypothetical protein